MIQLTRLNHVPLMINSDLIELIEVTPDTVITLTTGQKIMVLEASDEVLRRTVEFRQRVLRGVLQCPRLEAETTAGECGPGSCPEHGA